MHLDIASRFAIPINNKLSMLGTFHYMLDGGNEWTKSLGRHCESTHYTGLLGSLRQAKYISLLGKAKATYVY